MEKLGAVVVAAGRGTRMGTAESKQYLLLDGKPIVVHTLETLQHVSDIDAVVLVVGEEDLERSQALVEKFCLTKVKAVVAGGAERQDSVYSGLLVLERLGMQWILVHDAVRPFAAEDRIAACYRAARHTGGAVLAVPVKDTVKIVDPSGLILQTPDRRSLWAVQTPQVFRLFVLKQAHEFAQAEGFTGTDDASLLERAGFPVTVVEGRYDNIKITTPEDLALADYLYNHGKGETPS